jgi:hypothetical protein
MLPVACASIVLGVLVALAFVGQLLSMLWQLRFIVGDDEDSDEDDADNIDLL